MRKILVTLLATTLIASIGALADDTHPDCTADQRAGTSDAFSERTKSFRDNSGGKVGACEGEQWDGQDPVSPEYSGNLRVATDISVQYRGSRDGYQPDEATDPLHVRASTDGSQAYVRTDIYGVGVAGAYASGSMAAVYLQDYSDSIVEDSAIEDDYDNLYNAAHTARYGSGEHDSEGNALAGIVHFPHVTQGSDFGEESTDCDQASYSSGTCSRDNTAVTVEYLP